MRLILTLKHWQIFLLLLAYEFLTVGFLNFAELSTPTFIDDFLFGWIPMTIYPLLLGLGLNKHITTPNEENKADFKSFLSFGLLWTIIFSLNQLLKGAGDIFTMLALVVLLISLFKFIQFPSRTINSIELKRTAGLWEYIADSFQILFWPLCIFWIQPRINKIADKRLKVV